MGVTALRFVFLTKTDWSEPPRIRHQLARLLVECGHEVHFVQRASSVFRSWQFPGMQDHPEPGVWLYRGAELLHHRLRPVGLAHHANAFVEARRLGQLADRYGWNQPDVVIVNFNYDGFFVRSVLRDRLIMTVINDDFVGTAPFGLRRAARWVLARTCAASDQVVVLSEPLRRMLSMYCKPSVMLPWADIGYREPPQSDHRCEFLFWGYINSRIDLRVLSHWMQEGGMADRGLVFRFVGPSATGSSTVRRLRRMGAIVEGLMPLDRCVGPQTLAAIMPYEACAANTCTTLPNKAPALLARGLPLVVSGMPEVLDAPFVIQPHCVAGGFGAVVRALRDSFSGLQPVMKRYTEGNSPDSRVRQLSQLLNIELSRC